jgi:hypothetical protein
MFEKAGRVGDGGEDEGVCANLVQVLKCLYGGEMTWNAYRVQEVSSSLAECRMELASEAKVSNCSEQSCR